MSSNDEARQGDIFRKQCITVRSFSAVGLFFGFLVRDTLTKLWKLVDLEEETLWLLMSRWAPFHREQLLGHSAHPPFGFVF